MIDIEKAIPHRPPFLFVDRVIEITKDKIVTEKYLSPDLDFFKGHYPGFPIMPGVLTCECVFQGGAILLSEIMKNENIKGAPVITRIRDARFKRMVKPGETLKIFVELTDRVDIAFFMKARAKVGDETAALISFTCAIAPMPGNKSLV